MQMIIILNGILKVINNPSFCSHFSKHVTYDEICPKSLLSTHPVENDSRYVQEWEDSGYHKKPWHQ